MKLHMQKKMVCENHWPNMNLIELSYGMEGLDKLIVNAYHWGLLLEGRELRSCQFYCINVSYVVIPIKSRLSRAEKKSNLKIFHHTKYNLVDCYQRGSCLLVSNEHTTTTLRKSNEKIIKIWRIKWLSCNLVAYLTIGSRAYYEAVDFQVLHYGCHS